MLLHILKGKMKQFKTFLMVVICLISTVYLWAAGDATSSTGVCSLVTQSGTQYYSTFRGAISDAVTSGGTIHLLKDIQIKYDMNSGIGIIGRKLMNQDAGYVENWGGPSTFTATSLTNIILDLSGYKLTFASSGSTCQSIYNYRCWLKNVSFRIENSSSNSAEIDHLSISSMYGFFNCSSATVVIDAKNTTIKGLPFNAATSSYSVKNGIFTTWNPSSYVSSPSTVSGSGPWTVSTPDPICKLIGSDGTTEIGQYASLQSAVDAASTGNTIELLSNICYDTQTNISGKNITLDLSTYNITPDGMKCWTCFSITNNGTLNIKGNSSSYIKGDLTCGYNFGGDNTSYVVFTEDYLGRLTNVNGAQIANFVNLIFKGGTYTECSANTLSSIGTIPVGYIETNVNNVSTISTATPYNITCTATNGTVTSSPASQATQGSTVTLTLTPTSGYQLNTISCVDAGSNAVSLSGTGNTRTFTMPASAVTVTADFTPIPPVCAVYESNGTTLVGEYITYDAAFTAIGDGKNSAYILKLKADWTTKASGTTGDNENDYVLPSKNITIDLDTYTMNAPTRTEHMFQIQTGKTLSFKGTVSSNLYVNCTYGYFVESIYTQKVFFTQDFKGTCYIYGINWMIGRSVDDITKSMLEFGGGKFNFDSASAAKVSSSLLSTGRIMTGPVDGWYTITQAYSITCNATNGTVTSSPASQAVQGATVTLTLTPSTGYQLSTITCTDANSQSVALSGSGNTRTFTMPSSDVTVTATFTPITYTINCTATNGTVTASPSPATYGATVTLTATPTSSDYVLTNISCVKTGSSEVVALSGSGNTRTFTMPAEPVSVTAAFKQVVCYLNTDVASNQYTTLSDAFAAANNLGSGPRNIYLTADVPAAEVSAATIPVSKDITLNMGSHTITSSLATLFNVTGDATLTINGQDATHPGVIQMSANYNTVVLTGVKYNPGAASLVVNNINTNGAFMFRNIYLSMLQSISSATVVGTIMLTV